MDRSRIGVVEGSGAVKLATSTTPFNEGRTPSYNRTPGRYGASSQTPVYGSGSQTPMHDSMDGSRTPHFGSMTPAYNTEGGRTPQYSNSWDPALVAATPARSVINDDDEEDRFTMRTPAYTENGLLILFISRLTTSPVKRKNMSFK